MGKTLKIIAGCLASLWAIRSLLLIPSAFANLNSSFAAGNAAGVASAFLVSTVAAVLLLRSAFRKPKRQTIPQ